MEVFGQLIKAQLENLTSDPVGVGLVPGLVWYRTDQKLYKVYDGTAVQTFVDLTTAQTLSNKILSSPQIDDAGIFEQITTPANPSAGYSKLYPKSDGKFYSLDPAGNEAVIGSGSGGSKNFITNGNADDTASSIFAPYQDSSGARPADGTGGTTTGITTSISAASPLDGTKSFLLTKDAANRQGGGWAIPFTVDPAYRAKSVKISLPYIVNSGTFVAGTSSADSDVIWYIYDVTNSQLIEPSNIKMFSNSSTISDMFEATFQTSATGSSYRLIAHIASTSALAYELKVDEVKVSPQVYVYGTPVIDWRPVTVTGSWITNTTYTAFEKIVGDTALYKVSVKTSGAPTAANLSINLPSGRTIDTTKLISTNNAGHVIGFGGTVDGGIQNYECGVWYATPTSVDVANWDSSTATVVGNRVSSTNPITFGANDEVNVEFSVPIVGLSSSVRMSNDASTRAVNMTNQGDPTITITGVPSVAKYPAADTDSHGKYDPSTGLYTFAIPGVLSVDASIAVTATYAANNNVTIAIYKNGVAVRSNLVPAGSASVTTLIAEVSGKIPGVAGDTVGIYVSSNGTTPTVPSGVFNFFDLAFDQGPQAIAASEKIKAKYTSTSGQSIPNATTTIIDFANKVYDSHGAVTTGASWKFTAPRAGLLKLDTMIIWSAATWTTTGDQYIELYKNGVNQGFIDFNRIEAGGAFNQPKLKGHFSLEVLAGDYIDVRIYQNESAARTITTGTGAVKIEIELD